uniref:Nucleolar complex protein 2 homolog n=1 Tax=Acrobeloides nanus TaxID=290746 RepID=A0A914EBE5_9BILA
MAKIKNRNKPKNKQNVAKKLHKKLKKEKRPFENAPIANISSAEDVNLVTKKKKKRNKKKVQENGVLSPVQWLDEPGSGSTGGGKTAPIPVKKSKKKKKKANQKKQSEGLEKQQNGLVSQEPEPKPVKSKQKKKKAKQVESEKNTEKPKKTNSSSHNKELKALIEQDPELSKFLQQEDADLLDFDVSDVESSDDDSAVVADEEPEEVDEIESKLSDQASFKIKTNVLGEKVVDRELLKSLQEVFIESNPSRKSLAKALKIAVKAFRSCVARIGGNVEETTDIAVKDEKIFDAVIRLCFAHLGRALLTVLTPLKEEEKSSQQKEASKKKKPSTKPPYKYWAVHRLLVKDYLHSILSFLNEIQTDDVVISTVRAIVDLIPLYIHFSKMSKNMIKALVRVWSRNSENCKCIAFVALCKLARLDRKMYPVVYKQCYVAYISNSKLVSEETLPLISFMWRSFAELTLLDPALAYQYAFVYIRQFSLHLRNAMIAKRKDLIKTVYNWQFISGLKLWTETLVVASERNHFQGAAAWLKELIYPLIQIIVGVMKVFPIVRYLPLRFHCVKMLLQLQTKCDVFIPTLGFSTELLNDLVEIDLKKPSFGKGAVKVTDLKELLKLSKEMLADAGYRQLVAQEIYHLCQESANLMEKSECSFNESASMVETFKKFFKACKNPDHNRLFQSLFTKLKDEKKLLEKVRSRPPLALSESEEKEINANIEEALDDVEALAKENGSMKDHIIAKAEKLWKKLPQNSSGGNQWKNKRKWQKNLSYQEPKKEKNFKKFKRADSSFIG